MGFAIADGLPHPWLCIVALALVVFLAAGPAQAEKPHAAATEISPSEVTGFERFGREFAAPVGSLFLPGLGQWATGAVGPGFAFFGAAMAGLVIAESNNESHPHGDGLPRTREEQAYELGLQLSFDAGLMSGYDSFRRSLPKLKVGGHYSFIDEPTSLSEAFVAPFKFKFLKNKKTWIFLSIPIAIVAAVAIDNDGETLPFEAHDAFYAGALSYGAGVSEEAFFRGYLYPWINRLWGERVWWANTTQALVFGALHFGSTDVPIVQTLGAFYWGWIVKNSGWDFQETIFQHFWWDAILVTGALLFDDGNDTIGVTLPVIRF